MRFSNGAILMLASAILMPTLAVAANANINFDPAGNTKGTTALTSIKQLTFLSAGRDPATATFALINTALGFLGFVSMVIILYGGVMWFRSGDNEEHLTKAKGLITGAFIGLTLALGALALSTLIFNVAVTPTLTASPTTTEETTTEPAPVTTPTP